MQCQICKHTNPKTLKVCEVCGSPLPRVTVLDKEAAQGQPWASPAPPQVAPPQQVAWQPSNPAAPVPVRPSPAPVQQQPQPPVPVQAQPQAQPFRPPVPAPISLNRAAPNPSHLQLTGSVPPTLTQSQPHPAVGDFEPCPPTAPEDHRTYVAAASPEQVTSLQPVRGVLLDWSNPLELGPILALRAGPNSVGRSPECAVRLEDHQVSKHHATIVIRGEEGTYVDVSTNGSLVDGQKVQYGDAPLKHGSVLVIGARRYVVLLVPEQALAPHK